MSNIVTVQGRSLSEGTLSDYGESLMLPSESERPASVITFYAAGRPRPAGVGERHPKPRRPVVLSDLFHLYHRGSSSERSPRAILYDVEVAEGGLPDAVRFVASFFSEESPVIIDQGEFDIVPLLNNSIALNMSEDGGAIRVPCRPDGALVLPAKGSGRICFIGGRWVVKMAATAIVLAGGRSRRMRGADKSLLEIEGMSMREYLVSRLIDHFDDVILSVGSGAGCRLPGVVVMPDTGSGVGPVMGLLTSLQGSESELNFVTGCDMPDIDMSLIYRLMTIDKASDASLLLSDGKREPLFAVYRKRVESVAADYLAGGGRSFIGLLERLRVEYVEDKGGVININSPQDYLDFLKRRKDNEKNGWEKR